MNDLLYYLEQHWASQCRDPTFIWGRPKRETLWRQLYENEELLRPIAIPPEYKGENDCPYYVFGQIQKSLPLDHRGSVVLWMADACNAPAWTYATYFVAVQILDSYMIKATHLVSDRCLAKVAAACLYLGAHLRETSYDEGRMSLTHLHKLCETVGRAEEIREFQAHILDVIQANTLCTQTPHDLIVLFLAEMTRNSNFHFLMVWMKGTDYTTYIYEILIELSVVCYINGLCLILPATSWIASGLALTLLSLQQLLRERQSRVPTKVADWARQPSYLLIETIAKDIVHFPGGASFLLPLVDWVRPIIQQIPPIIDRCPTPRLWRAPTLFLRDSLSKHDLIDPLNPFVRAAGKSAVSVIRELRAKGLEVYNDMRRRASDLSRSEGSLIKGGAVLDFAILTTSSSIGSEVQSRRHSIPVDDAKRASTAISHTRVWYNANLRRPLTRYS